MYHTKMKLIDVLKNYWVLIVALVTMIGWWYTTDMRIAALEQTSSIHTAKLASYDTTLTQIQIELAKLNANVELLIRGKTLQQ